jgi:hypothetical protein
MLAQSTNQYYTGPLWASYALLLAAAQSLIGGGLQVILPDSGLISIAGFNLSHEGGLQMIALAAWGGATQIVWGLVLALGALRYRSFTALLLLLVVIEKSLILIGQMIKPTGDGLSPPGFDSAVVLLVICFVALIVVARRGRAKS